MAKRLPENQRKILDEMARGTTLARVQAFAWAKVKHMLGDKQVADGTVAQLAMAGLVRPNTRIELGAERITFELTEKGERRLREAA